VQKEIGKRGRELSLRRRNRGSAVIEMTMMVPIILGCIYFYIMSMLFLIEHGKVADDLSYRLYSYSEENTENDDGDKKVILSGNTEVISYGEVFNNYELMIELKKEGSDVVKNLRRWQLIADTIN
jgi:hypothetical protein